jgi:DNA-binding transcriptional LysR family regulator
MHATPAAISLRIKVLEEELQTALIDRSVKEFRLTPNAEYLLGHAKAVVDATRRLQQAAQMESAVRGRLRLGVVETVVHSWLAHSVRQLNAGFPELEIDLVVDMSMALERRLLAGELDLMVGVEGLNGSEITSEPLAVYPVRWIAREGLLSPQKEGLAQRVLQFPILTFGRGTVPHRMLEDIVARLANLSGMPLEQTRITCSPSVAAIIQLIKDGFGVAAIPWLFVSSHLESGEFVELPLRQLPPPIIVSMSRRTNAAVAAHAAASAVRMACTEYCGGMHKRYIEHLS